MSQSTLQDPDRPILLFDFINLARVLWNRRGIVAGAGGAALLLALAYILVTPPTYVATAVVLVDPREAQVTEASNVLPGIGNDSAAIASQVAVIRSRQLLDAVFISERIAEDPEFAGRGLIANVLATFGGTDQGSGSAEAFDRFAAALSVDREGLTYVIRVSFRSGDAVKAARIANAVVDQYIAQLRTDKATANSQMSDLLTGSIAGLQEEVARAEAAVELFRVRHAIFESAGSGTTLNEVRINQVNEQLLRAREAAREATTAYEQALSIGADPAGIERLTEIASSTSAEALRQEYNQRAALFASTQSRLGPRHPDFLSQEAELSRVSSLIGFEAQRITRELKARSDASAENVAKLEAELVQLRTEANEVSRRTVELRQLERDAQAKRSVLDQFLTRSEETGQLQDLQLSNAKLISAAHPPTQALWPRPSLLLALAGALGLFAGCGTAVLLGAAAPASPPVLRVSNFFRTGTDPNDGPAPAPAANSAAGRQPMSARPYAKLS